MHIVNTLCRLILKYSRQWFPYDRLVSRHRSMLIPVLSFRFAEPVPVLFCFSFRCTVRVRTGAVATVDFILTVYFLNCRLRTAHTSVQLAYFLSYSILRNHDRFRTSADLHLDSAKQGMPVHCTPTGLFNHVP